jgi:hypothetical protein
MARPGTIGSAVLRCCTRILAGSTETLRGHRQVIPEPRPTNGRSLRHRYLTRIALPDLSRPKKRGHFCAMQILCKVPAWFLNRQVNGNLCMIVTEN